MWLYRGHTGPAALTYVGAADRSKVLVERPGLTARHRASLKALAPLSGSYALFMKRFRALLEHLRGGDRPPTGPLTTSEAADAEKLRQETLAKDDERVDHEQADARPGSNSDS
jgi:hypothetical protein